MRITPSYTLLPTRAAENEREWEHIPSDPAARLGWLRQREGEDLRAKFSLGVCYAQGHPGLLERDMGTALRYFREAAEAGNAQAAAELGFLYLAGDDEAGLVVDAAEGARWLQVAADKDHPEALHHVGMLHRRGHGVEKDLPKAVKCFQRAATLGHVASIYQFGVCKANGEGTKKESAWAIQCFAEAAEKGDLDAMHDLAMCFKLGLAGVPKDAKLAVKWFRRGADGGSVECVNQVGQCYLRGIGLRRQPKEAARWLGAATMHGHDDAAWCMGQLYALGQGVKRDEAAAARCYAVAAAGGHPSASHNLASAYATGAGVEKDTAQAEKLFRAAARGGVSAAKMSLEALGVEIKKQDAMREISRAFDQRWSVFVKRAGVEGGTPVTAADLPVPDDETLRAMLSAGDDERVEVNMRWNVDNFSSAFRTRMDPTELNKSLAIVEKVAERIERTIEMLANLPPQPSSSSSSSRRVASSSTITTANIRNGSVAGRVGARLGGAGAGLNSTSTDRIRCVVSGGGGPVALSVKGQGQGQGRPPKPTVTSSTGGCVNATRGVPKTATVAGGAAKAARGLKNTAAAAEAAAVADELASVEMKSGDQDVPPAVAPINQAH